MLCETNYAHSSLDPSCNPRCIFNHEACEEYGNGSSGELWYPRSSDMMYAIIVCSIGVSVFDMLDLHTVAFLLC